MTRATDTPAQALDGLLSRVTERRRGYELPRKGRPPMSRVERRLVAALVLLWAAGVAVTVWAAWGGGAL